MSKSITYYLTLWVIKMKGIKKTFSKSPIDYWQLRKEDIKFPKNRFFKRNNTSTFTITETQITEIANHSNPNKLILYIHGGAFVSGPAQHHWDTIEKIAKATNFTIWMCDYPKAPEYKIAQMSINMDLVYELAIQKFNSENIVLIGDSAGGTLAIALVQRLIQKAKVLPSKLILISPILDASFENPKIEDLDKKDPMLSKQGVLSAKKMCIDDDNLKNSEISPLYGSFKGFPPTHLFIADNDISFPDQLLFCEKLENDKVDNTVYKGEGMPHIWPLLPIMKEARIALNRIIALLNGY